MRKLNANSTYGKCQKFAFQWTYCLPHHKTAASDIAYIPLTQRTPHFRSESWYDNWNGGCGFTLFWVPVVASYCSHSEWQPYKTAKTCSETYRYRGKKFYVASKGHQNILNDVMRSGWLILQYATNSTHVKQFQCAHDSAIVMNNTGTPQNHYLLLPLTGTIPTRILTQLTWKHTWQWLC